MTVKQAAKQWGLSESTVTRYCRSRVEMGPGIFAVKKVQWEIPDQAVCPYLPGKKPFDAAACYKHILSAVGTEKYLSPVLLGISKSRLLAYLQVICEAGYIRLERKELAPDNTANYILTLDGVDWNRKQYPGLGKELLNTIVESLAKGATKGVIEGAVK